MLRVAARIALLCVFAACAAEPPAAAATPPEQPMDRVLRGPVEEQLAWRLLTELAQLTTADQMRAHLEADLTKQELQFRGFDDVTIAECIDDLVAASLDARRRPGDPQVRARLDESAALFVAAHREATVRRIAGAASCMPPVR